MTYFHNLFSVLRCVEYSGPPAVDEQSVALLCHGGHELVHYAAGHLSEVMLCLLTSQCLSLQTENKVKQSYRVGIKYI